MDSLTLLVLESRVADYEEYQQHRKTDHSTGNQQWLEKLKRLETPELTKEERDKLNKLRREKYGRLFAEISLKELKALANNQSSKDTLTDEEKRAHEREWEEQGESVQEAYLSLLALLPREQLSEQQVKHHKMLRLISWNRRKHPGHKNHFNPTDALHVLPGILQRKEPAELTDTEREWKEYQDLQFEELHGLKTSGTGKALTEEEERELAELSISRMQRKKREDMDLEEVEMLHATLKAQLSEETREIELLEWLDMRRIQLNLIKLKEKAPRL